MAAYNFMNSRYALIERKTQKVKTDYIRNMFQCTPTTDNTSYNSFKKD